MREKKVNESGGLPMVLKQVYVIALFLQGYITTVILAFRLSYTYKR